MKHIDLFGTIIIPLIGILMIGDVTFELVPLFGWGKRLEYDSRVLRNGAKSEVVLGAVGIVSLVFVAALVAILGKLFIDSNSLFYPLMGQTVFVAVFLAVLNLVPLPPLEGWTWLRVLMGWHRDFERMYAPWIFIVFIIVMNFTPLLFVIYGLSKALFLVLV
ncbi:MAG: hypothetical protein NZM04_03180 [Methylacidiphilales bacterium]|nr:hypothetical protein [Candidatus Methylacidiphilales bacterium]MDW8348736.1 hypothetical protein [Verrucomicrobiae bacterium]